jgi:hypothetical protein
VTEIPGAATNELELTTMKTTMRRREIASMACLLLGLGGCSQGPMAIGEGAAGQEEGGGSGGSASSAAGSDGRSGATSRDAGRNTGGTGGSADRNTGGQSTAPGDRETGGTGGTPADASTGGTTGGRPDQGTGGKHIQPPDLNAGGSAGTPADANTGGTAVGPAGGGAGAPPDAVAGSNAGGAAGAGGETRVCDVALPLRCGDRLSHSTIEEGRPNQWYGYACTQRWEGGRESIYAFVTDEDCQVEMRLVDLTVDLDLLLLAQCDPSPCGACQADSAAMSNAEECSSIPLDLQDGFVEQIDFDTLAGQARTVVVDGYDYDEGTYTLEVDCTCG